MDQDAIDQFVNVTGSNPSTAKFYIESSKNDVAAAIDQYFSSGGQVQAEESVPVEPSRPRAAVASAIAPASSGRTDSAPAAGKPTAGKGKAKRAPGGVRSLADMAKDSEEDSSEDEGNEYYTGGHKSGQVVKGAPKNKDAEPKVSRIFDRAREMGATQGNIDDLRQPAALGGGAFTGRSNTLAGGPSTSDAGPGEAAQPPTQPVVHTITFYSNDVFTVNHGEPREVMDPANRAFMEAITRGECPAELDPGNRTQPISVNLVKSEKPYEAPPQPKYKAFSGSGQTLAGPSSASASTSQAAASTTITTAWQGINEAEPSTSIQIRLADGTRMVAKFNLTQTVADIRRFIKASRPDMQEGYGLQMNGFPPKQLSNNEESIKDAGLEGAVVIQKQ